MPMSTVHHDIDIQIPILLSYTQKPANIGASARAMINCGFHELRLIAPLEDINNNYANNTNQYKLTNWCHKECIALAAGSLDYMHKIHSYPSITKASHGLELLYATTNRVRGMAVEYITLEQAVIEIAEHYALQRRIGILFGSEQCGLMNHEIQSCHKAIIIDLNSEFCSLNLSQAVMLVCYALFRRIETQLNNTNIRINNLEKNMSMIGKKRHAGMLCPKATIDKLLSFIDQFIQASNKFNNHPKTHKMLATMKHFFYKSIVTEQDARSLFGILKVLTDTVQQNNDDH